MKVPARILVFAAALTVLASCKGEEPERGVFTGIYANPMLVWNAPKADVASYNARCARAFDFSTATFYWPVSRETGTLYSFKDGQLKAVFVYVSSARYSKEQLEEWLSGQYKPQEGGGWLTGDGVTAIVLDEISGDPGHFTVSYAPANSGAGLSELSFTRPGFLCPQCGEFIRLPLDEVISGSGFSCQKCKFQVNILTIR